MKPFSLEGQTALVTGANTGIGQAIAIAMGAAGAHVICAGRSSCADTASRLSSAEELSLDFSDPMAARGVFVNRKVDILVNNAGVIRREDSTELTEADWDDVINVNLKSVFFTCQAFAKAVLERNGTGRIVNIASLLAFQGGIRVASYTASKHGVAGITKLLANEWQPKTSMSMPSHRATSRPTTPKRCGRIRYGTKRYLNVFQQAVGASRKT